VTPARKEGAGDQPAAAESARSAGESAGTQQETGASTSGTARRRRGNRGGRRRRKPGEGATAIDETGSAGADVGATATVVAAPEAVAVGRKKAVEAAKAETARDDQGGAGAAAPARAGGGRRRGRSGRKPAEPATDAVDAEAPARSAAAEAEFAAAAGGPAGGPGGADDESDAAPPKRRHRGSRGGRRRRKAADAEHAEIVREAEEAVGDEAPSQADAEPVSTPYAGIPTVPLVPSVAAPEVAAPEVAPPEVAPPAQPVRALSGFQAAVAAALGGDAAQTPAPAPEATAPIIEAVPPAAEAAAAAAKAGEPPHDATREARPSPARVGGYAISAAEPLSAAAERESKAARDAEVQAGAGAEPETESETPPKSGGRSRRGGRRRGKGRAAAEDAASAGAGAEAAAGAEAVLGEGPTTAAPAGEAMPAPEEAEAGQETPAGADDAGAPAKRRRRGARGGRKARERSGEDEAAPPAEDEAQESPVAEKPAARKAAAKAAAKPAAERADGKSRRRERDHRRPKAIVRQDEGSGLGTTTTAPSPRSLGVTASEIKRRIILVTDDGQELRVALVEDGRLAEIYIERPDKKSYLGDIYQGKVENVMGGIDAAFVDFGLEKNGFLYVDEVTTPEGEKRARRIGDALKNGQQVLVQVTKDPMGHKGARLSTKISLAGRYLVYVPGGSGVGVSRRLRDSERDRLRDISKQLKAKDAGIIVRTIAEGHGLEDLKRDLQYLSRLWSRLKKKAETVKAPGLVHKEVDISIEVARDLFNDTCESLIVDAPKRHKAIVAFLDKEAPELLPKVHRHDGEEPLFEAYGIEEQIAQALERRVPLPSGGNLVIDHAEALTVIDVNTGRFTRGKGLEDTITKTNLEAAREVVRQLRLRDIGGIIIIDAIDMAHAKNREMVLATLEAELETDRTKTYVVELSPLGLIEMTRQNTTDGARGILTRACPTCQGKARVMSDETMALSVERRVRALARKSQAKAWLIEVNGAVAERLSGDRLKRLEKEVGRRLFFEGSAGLPVETFHVLSEGLPAHVLEQRLPLQEGQEAELELEFSLTYSPRDAVGYVDGYMVIVEGGRQYLGERRKVRVTSTSRAGATATVLKKGSN